MSHFKSTLETRFSFCTQFAKTIKNTKVFYALQNKPYIFMLKRYVPIIPWEVQDIYT